jgi:hypothetical protein
LTFLAAKVPQGDPIGIIFSSWVSAHLGKFLDNGRKSPCLKKKSMLKEEIHAYQLLCIGFDKERIGLQFGRFFPQTHPVTLVSLQEGNRILKGD